MNVVKEKGIDFKSDELTTRKEEKIAEWTQAASDVDPKNQPIEAAAWQAALDDIMKKGDYRSLEIIKNLYSEDIEAMMSLIYSGGIIDHGSYKRLSEQGVVFRSRSIHIIVNIGSYAFSILIISLTLFAFVPSLLDVLAQHFPVDISFKSGTEIYSVMMTPMMMLAFAIFAFLLSRAYIKYINVVDLTLYGRELANKIRVYLDDN